MSLVGLPVVRADHCGSFIRPDYLRKARIDFALGAMSEAELQNLENTAILDVLQMQREVGIGIYSDGEYRRRAFMTVLHEALDGIADGGITEANRRQLQQKGIDPSKNPIYQMPNPIVVGKLQPRRRLTSREIEYMKNHSPGPFKITMPAFNTARRVSSWFKEGVTEEFYQTREDLAEELLTIMEAEFQAVADDGVPYIQLDVPGYTALVSVNQREQLRREGIDPDVELQKTIDADNRLLRAAKREGNIIGVHVCHGSYPGGGDTLKNLRLNYDARALARLLEGLEADTFTLEYSERSGGLEALKQTALGAKVLALGVVNVLTPEIENADDIVRRIEQASKFVPLENLALCNNCGFSGGATDAYIRQDEQREKLALISSTSRQIWGSTSENLEY